MTVCSACSAGTIAATAAGVRVASDLIGLCLWSQMPVLAHLPLIQLIALVFTVTTLGDPLG